jgi:hypothetical protein
MKKFYSNRNLYLALVLGFFSIACDSTDPLPISTAGFKVTSVAPEVNVPVQFENLSLNADVYSWDYGDGNKDSLVTDPMHTYDAPGAYTVTLRAYTKDGQKSESQMDVDVGERYLTAMYLINIDMTDENGDPWDADGSGPDVFFQFFPEDITSEEEFIGVFYDSLNVGTNATPTGISGIENYKLLNKNYVVLTEEINTADLEEDPRYMDGVLFNPINPEDDYITVTKREDGSGDIVIPFVDLLQYQYYLEFEIK